VDVKRLARGRLNAQLVCVRPAAFHERLLTQFVTGVLGAEPSVLRGNTCALILGSLDDYATGTVQTISATESDASGVPGTPCPPEVVAHPAKINPAAMLNAKRMSRLLTVVRPTTLSCSAAGRSPVRCNTRFGSAPESIGAEFVPDQCYHRVSVLGTETRKDYCQSQREHDR
jgi:hypothetical protein